MSSHLKNYRRFRKWERVEDKAEEKAMECFFADNLGKYGRFLRKRRKASINAFRFARAAEKWGEEDRIQRDLTRHLDSMFDRMKEATDKVLTMIEKNLERMESLEIVKDEEGKPVYFDTDSVLVVKP